MIDEELNKTINLVAQYIPPQTWIDKKAVKTEALTAIYEIGLECIGADDLWSNDSAFTRTELRNEQRKAWAKACGVNNA